jgi:hypothetical protein
MRKALFEGLVVDDGGNPVTTGYVGEDPTYIVVEDGFKYHVDARHVDEQVLNFFRQQVDQNKDMVSDGMLKMMGKNDLFSKAAVDSSLRNIDKNFSQLMEQGIPEQGRMYLGMLGMRIVINRQGDVVHMDMPSSPGESDDE